jgi:hypothetical protein
MVGKRLAGPRVVRDDESEEGRAKSGPGKKRLS